MEDEVKKYLDANGRRIIEEWCSLQKDTLLRQLIGFLEQERWEAEHGVKKEPEEEDLEADRSDRLIGVPESILDEEREQEPAGGLSPEPINLSIPKNEAEWNCESTNVNMIVNDLPPAPPALVRQQAIDCPRPKTDIGKAL